MYHQLEQRLHAIETQRLYADLRAAQTGLEKENLRVNPLGYIAQTGHPAAIGSALTHPWITTDYAEALLELITPPQAHAPHALDFLLDLKTFVYQQLQDELLWTNSMPCILRGEDDIRIAEYGSSNAGRMKHIYRQGLAWRYGKTMQVIAGIHFNYSIAETFWEPWHALEGAGLTLRAFRDQQYMALARNLQRYGWLVIYLFGTSPAICKSFLGGRAAPDSMREFNAHTLYEPYGTSLRMGKIGYSNNKEKDTGAQVCYDSLQSYTTSLRQAISTPSAEYEKIGIKVNGEYRQLNANILQIENEYYSTVRPKQPLQGFEKPTDALIDRGIRYIELRTIDINTFQPAGLSHQQLYFLETFMHFCLLQESPLIRGNEKQAIHNNQLRVAHQGRAPKLALEHRDAPITLTAWAGELLREMQPVAHLLDQVHDCTFYTEALRNQRDMVNHPELTPSARMLADMHEQKDDSFFDFVQRKSAEHRKFFLQRQLSGQLKTRFSEMAKESLDRQQTIENNDKIDLDTFLERYFAGSL